MYVSSWLYVTDNAVKSNKYVCWLVDIRTTLNMIKRAGIFNLVKPALGMRRFCRKAKNKMLA